MLLPDLARRSFGEVEIRSRAVVSGSFDSMFGFGLGYGSQQYTPRHDLDYRNQGLNRK